MTRTQAPMVIVFPLAIAMAADDLKPNRKIRLHHRAP